MDAPRSDHLRACPPPPAAVVAALAQALASEDLRLSARNRRFLSFVVLEALAGRGERIKAYLIGVDVFGRDESFDPGRDPIVRIEATRLRTALNRYYERSRAAHAVRIALRPGSYVPSFEWASASEDDGRSGPLPVVLTHCREAQDPAGALRSAMVAEAIAARLPLSRFALFVPPPPLQGAAGRFARAPVGPPRVGLSLDVAVRSLAEGHRYRWTVCDVDSGLVLLSECIDRRETGRPRADPIDALADRAIAALEVVASESHASARLSPRRASD